MAAAVLASPFQLPKKKRTRPALRIATGHASAKGLGSPVALAVSDIAEQRAKEMFTSRAPKRHRGYHHRQPLDDLPWVWRLDTEESADGDLSALVDLSTPKRPKRSPYQRPLRERHNRTLTFHELMPVYPPAAPPSPTPLRPRYDYLYTHGHLP